MSFTRHPVYPKPLRLLAMHWSLLGITLFLAALLFLGLGPLSAWAHGCEGQASCNGGQLDQSTRHMKQQQGQQQTINNRRLDIRPVAVPPAQVLVPSADVSRYVDGACGPRMVVESLAIRGVNNRALSAQAIEAGYDQYLKPDIDNVYRRVDVAPGLYQLIGHKVVETTATVTVSTASGFALGLFGSNGGGSGGTSGAGAVQRLATTLRLVECVAYEVDERPATAVVGIRG